MARIGKPKDYNLTERICYTIFINQSDRAAGLLNNSALIVVAVNGVLVSSIHSPNLLPDFISKDDMYPICSPSFFSPNNAAISNRVWFFGFVIGVLPFEGSLMGWYQLYSIAPCRPAGCPPRPPPSREAGPVCPPLLRPFIIAHWFRGIESPWLIYKGPKNCWNCQHFSLGGPHCL